MTDLLKSESAWLWENAQADAFSRVKQLLTSAPVLTFYDPCKPIVVSADASSFGLGQRFSRKREKSTNQSHFVPKTFGTELKYSQIEKECLASLWAC